VSDERIVRFQGEAFLAEFPVPPMALMEFAHIAADGVDSSDIEGYAAMYDLLESVIKPEDWDRFKRHAKKTRATDADLQELVGKVVSGQTERPTGRPSDSSDGPTGTDLKSESAPEPSPSEEPLHARVIRMHEKAGRPDKALIVLQAQEQQAASAV
jgi:hypothetical protein